MTAPPDKPTSKRWTNVLLVAVFMALLWLPTFDWWFHFDQSPAFNEKRPPAAWPQSKPGLDGLQQYVRGLEAYFNDHFGFRKMLVNWHNRFKWSFFKEQNANNVLVGTGGWIYMAERRMIEHFRGTLPFTEPELQAWQKLLEHRRDWLAQRGVKYIFVLAPDKHSVYPEFLPVWLKDLGGRTKADQFFDYMKAHSTVEVFDPRPVLFAAKKSAPVYLQTDTHWNQLGCFLVCEEMVRALAKHQLPEIAPVALDSFDRTNRQPKGGDLLTFRGTPISKTESNAVILIPKAELPEIKTFVPTGSHYQELATAKNPQGHGLAFVYTDSFGHGWIPFLGYQFGEADFYWQYPLDGRLIERQKPVVVISEMLERYFNVTDPKRLFAQDVLP